MQSLIKIFAYKISELDHTKSIQWTADSDRVVRMRKSGSGSTLSAYAGMYFAACKDPYKIIIVKIFERFNDWNNLMDFDSFQ